MKNSPINRMFVSRSLVPSAEPWLAAYRLHAGSFVFPCSIGRSGITGFKVEGDGATPRGSFELLYFYFRKDRFRRVASNLSGVSTRHDDAWCDDPSHPSYNRPVRAPFNSRHERMWRYDQLYDAVVVLDHNFTNRARGRGSAIFLHIRAEDCGPTEGCVAISSQNMAKLLPRLAPRATLEIR